MTTGPGTAIALTIAGSDSSGGAGIQADLKTFSALGAYGASVLTALTAQNTMGVQAIHDVPAAFVQAQIASVLDDLDVRAIKIGMLSRAGTIRAVAAALAGRGEIPVILDPVMVAASGDPLLRDSAVSALKRVLMPMARIATPNLHEAAALTGTDVAATESEMEAQARRILDFGVRGVLIKGGHGTGPESVDLLVESSGVTRFAMPRLATRNVHGTGCTLSSAITAGVARGLSLADAIGEAKTYVTRAIQAAARLEIGRGHGPAHHFHQWW